MKISPIVHLYQLKGQIILILCCFITTGAFAQTFRRGFDNAEYYSTAGSGQGASLYANVGSNVHNSETVSLMGFIRMFQATHDKRYLDKFIIHSKRVQERRDDNITQLPLNEIYSIPIVFSIDPPCSILDLSNFTPVNSKGWSFVEKIEFCNYDVQAIVHSGEITFAMAQFIWYMQTDPAFVALATETVPLEVQTVLASSGCPTTSISTYQQYADWLQCRVEETIEYHQPEWQKYTIFNPAVDLCVEPDFVTLEPGRYIFGSNNLNSQTAMGRTLALIYLMNGDPALHCMVTDIALWVHNRLNQDGEHFVTINGEQKQYYTWRYGWENNECTEDPGHAYLTMQFAEICYQNQITNSYDGSQLFNLIDMQLFANTYAYKMYKAPLDMWQSTNAGANDGIPTCLQGGGAQYSWLAKYNPYIFQIQSDGICENAIYNTGGHLIVLSDLSIQQSKHNLSNTLNNQNFKFNPVAVARDVSTTSQVFEMAGGDFDGDGMGDFVTVDAGTSGGGLIRAYSPQNCNNSDKNGCWQFATSAPHGFFEWRGMAAGDFNDQLAPFNNPGDELMALDENGNMYLFKKSGPGFAEWITNNPFFDWSGLTAGNFLPDPTDEGVAITTTGIIHFIFYNTGVFQVSSPVGTTGLNDVVGITAGQFDATDTRKQIAILDETTAVLRIYSYDVTTELFVQIHEFAAFGSANEFTSITSGDFDGDGIDELCVHRNKDGQLFVLKVNPSGLEHIYSEFFPTDQQISAMTTNKFSSSTGNAELAIFRNFDAQITIFEIEGNCPNLSLDGLPTPTLNATINHPVNGMENDYILDYHVNNTLVASNLNIDPGSTVDFVAGHAVVLKSGTSILPGSTFHAYIEPTLSCGDDLFLKTANATIPSNKEELDLKKEISTDEIPDEINFSATIYPNPNDGSFVLQLNGIKSNQPTLIEIYNSFGEVVYESSTSNFRTTFDLKDQANGIYFVKVQSEGNVVVNRVVIQ